MVSEAGDSSSNELRFKTDELLMCDVRTRCLYSHSKRLLYLCNCNHKAYLIKPVAFDAAGRLLINAPSKRALVIAIDSARMSATARHETIQKTVYHLYAQFRYQ